jgi:hypothetical protein
MKRMIQFIVLDLVVESRQGPGVETLQAFRDCTVDCLRELSHYIALQESEFSLSLIVVSNNDPAQVPPQRTSLLEGPY